MEISSEAKDVLGSASSGVMDYIKSTGGWGSKLNANEARRLLAQYQASPDAVMSASNISATQTNPTPAPDDLLGIRKQVNTELGVDNLQKTYQDIYGQLSQFDTATEEQTRQLGERALSTNVIRGEQATASNLRATERASIARQAEVAQSALLAAQQEARDVYGIRESEVKEKRQYLLQYPEAGFTMADSFNTISKKLGEYQEKVKKDEYKSSLKSKLIELGLKTSGNTKSLEKRLKKANKSAFEQTKKENELKLEQLRLNIEDTKSQIANRGKDKDTSEADYQKMEMQLNNDVDEWKLKMREGKANWADAFRSIQNTYGLDVEDIDGLLGLDYRDKFDKSLS